MNKIIIEMYGCFHLTERVERLHSTKRFQFKYM